MNIAYSRLIIHTYVSLVLEYDTDLRASSKTELLTPELANSLICPLPEV